MIFDTNKTGTGDAWFSKNVSATGYITRTSVYNTADGSALAKIKNASDYLNLDGTINHTAFYGYVQEPVADTSRTETYKRCSNITINDTEKEVCENVIYYPYTINQDGVLLDKEVDVLRQGVYELNQLVIQQNTTINLLKSELCRKDPTYSFCLGGTG